MYLTIYPSIYLAEIISSFSFLHFMRICLVKASDMTIRLNYVGRILQPVAGGTEFMSCP